MLQAGSAKLDITPPLGATLAGSFVPRPAEDIHDPLHTRAIVLDDGHAQVALVSCDLIVVPTSDVDRAKRDILARTGLPPERVMICGTHTHSGPACCGLLGSDREDAYMDWAVRRMADVVVMAQRRLRPARIAWGSCQAPDHVFNRRFRMKDQTVRMNPGNQNPDVVGTVGPTDPQLGLLVVQDARRGTPIAVLANYALHYVGGQGGAVVSADYFAVMEHVLNREIGCAFPVLWLNGCCGDVNNIDVSRPRPELPPGGKMRQVAGDLACSALAVWDGLTFHDHVPLGAQLDRVPVRRRPVAPEDLAEAKARLAEDSDENDRDRCYAGEKVILSTWPETEDAPVQAFRIGDLGLATLPGEIFVSFGLDLKARSPFAQTMVVELANGYVGYVPTPQAFDEGGYETWLARSSRLVPEAGPAMAARAAEMLTSLAT